MDKMVVENIAFFYKVLKSISIKMKYIFFFFKWNLKLAPRRVSE